MEKEAGGTIFICGFEPAGLNDPAPQGYGARLEWARRQHEAGRVQKQCCMCCLWKFPQELDAHPYVSKQLDPRRGWRLSQSPICLKCKEVRDGKTLRG